MLNKYPKRSQDTASRIIDNEAVVVIPQEGSVKVLNEVGARIWQLLDGKHSLKDIIDIVSAEFDISTEEVQKDTLDFITELKEKDMVVLNNEPVV